MIKYTLNKVSHCNQFYTSTLFLSIKCLLYLFLLSYIHKNLPFINKKQTEDLENLADPIF